MHAQQDLGSLRHTMTRSETVWNQTAHHTAFNYLKAVVPTHWPLNKCKCTFKNWFDNCTSYYCSENQPSVCENPEPRILLSSEPLRAHTLSSEPQVCRVMFRELSCHDSGTKLLASTLRSNRPLTCRCYTHRIIIFPLFIT